MKIRRYVLKASLALLCLAGTTPAMAQFNLKKAVSGAEDAFRTALLTSALKDGISSQGEKAASLTDSQLGD